MNLTYYVYKDNAGYWRWNLQSSNGRKIADSGEGYVNKQDCISAINLVKASAGAQVIER